MSSKEPLLASAAAYTPPKAEPDLVGLPLRATWPLYCGFSRSAKVVGQVFTIALGVAADGDVAAVVVEPLALRVLLAFGDLVERGDLVRREQALLGGAQREGGAEVEDVGRTVLALAGGDGVDLVLAGAVRVLVRDLDAVLLGETVDEGTVVGPVAGQRDGVQRALLLGRLHQGVHAAEVGGGGGGGGVLAVGGRRRVVGSGAAGTEGQRGDDGEGTTQDGVSRRGHGHGLSRGAHEGFERNGAKQRSCRQNLSEQVGLSTPGDGVLFVNIGETVTPIPCTLLADTDHQENWTTLLTLCTAADSEGKHDGATRGDRRRAAEGHRP